MYGSLAAPLRRCPACFSAAKWAASRMADISRTTSQSAIVIAHLSSAFRARLLVSMEACQVLVLLHCIEDDRT